MNERMAVTAGALIGACVGAAASYLFFTDRGRELRDRLDPMMNDLQHEFDRFRGTIEQVGRMAGDGARAFHEFTSARAQSEFPGSRTSH